MQKLRKVIVNSNWLGTKYFSGTLTYVRNVFTDVHVIQTSDFREPLRKQMCKKNCKYKALCLTYN